MVQVIRMGISLRIFLLACALLGLVYILRKIKKSEIQVADTIFWFFFIGSFVLLAVVPQIAFFFSSVLGFQSPANLIFLYVVGVLLMREFSMTVKVARLRQKVNALIQEVALKDVKDGKEDDTAI